MSVLTRDVILIQKVLERRCVYCISDTIMIVFFTGKFLMLLCHCLLQCAKKGAGNESNVSAALSSSDEGIEKRYMFVGLLLVAKGFEHVRISQ